MLPVLTRKQVRELDGRAIDDFGLPGIVLMENAGRGVADVVCRLGTDGPVAVCCGSGNNGGDGFVIARHLDLRGYALRVLLFADPVKLAGDAAINYHVLAKSGIFVERPQASDLPARLADCSWIIDALLGTGASGQPRAPLDLAIEAINGSGIPIVAVDVPSGLDCDTGQPATTTIRAQHTCTFVAAKPGFFVSGAEKFVGTVHVLDIGAPRVLVEQMLGK